MATLATAFAKVMPFYGSKAISGRSLGARKTAYRLLPEESMLGGLGDSARLHREFIDIDAKLVSHEGGGGLSKVEVLTLGERVVGTLGTERLRQGSTKK